MSLHFSASSVHRVSNARNSTVFYLSRSCNSYNAAHLNLGGSFLAPNFEKKLFDFQG